MSPAQQVMLIEAGDVGEVGPMVEAAIRSEGYDILHATLSLLDRDAGAEETYAAVALVGMQAGDCGMELLQKAAHRLPAEKYLVVTPDGAPESVTLPEDVPQGQVLWLDWADQSDRAVESMRDFLRSDGYRWGSQLEPSGGAATGLFQGAAGGRGERKQETARLREFVEELSQVTDLNEMLRAALPRYLELLNCDAGSIYLWDQRTEALILKAAAGPESEQRMGIRQKMGEGLAGWVAEAGESILVTDTRKVHKLKDRRCSRYPDFSCLAAPISHGGQLFGVVCLTMQREEQPFDEEDLRLAEVLSQRLGSLIRPLSFLGELQDFNERLLEVLKTCSDLVVERDSQVESIRALSADILDGIPVGVVAYDPQLRVRLANSTAQELFGLQRQPRGDRRVPLQEGLDVDGDLWQRKLMDVVQSGSAFRLQRVAYRQGEQEKILDVRCSPLHGSEGRTVGGILTVQDVTDDVELEAQLSAAQRLALMGKLAARVAHELNNPLDGIMRFMKLAVRKLEDNPEQARDHLEECHTGLMRMSNILTQLLAFSRGRRAASRPISLSQVLRDAVTLYEHRAQECGVEIRVDVPPDLPRSSNGELCDAFGNLVKNALDAMEDGGRLTIEAEERPEAVRVRFADTGPGVAEDVRDKIFEPFFTTKKNGKGTGLGLAACRDSLKRAGGDVRLLPSDTGAVFEVTVPVDQRGD